MLIQSLNQQALACLHKLVRSISSSMIGLSSKKQAEDHQRGLLSVRRVRCLLEAYKQEEKRLARQKEEEEANIALITEWDDVQAMMDAYNELAKRLQAEEQGELTIEERSKLFVELINERKKHFTRLRAEENRRKPPSKAQKRNQMCSETRVEESSKRAGEELESDRSKKQKLDEKRSNRSRILNIVEPEIRTIVKIVPMADRTMEELLQAPTEGYGEAIVISEILAENFEIKTNLLQLVQANKFHGFERDNPHTHISNFERMTATLKYRDVLNDAIKLMLFLYSLEGAARVWYEKEPPNSILTWEDLVNKFVNQFFPPSKTSHLKNEISHFTQRFKETFSEAWDRFKELLRACPHHRFLELTQIDTFYNGLTEQDQDSLNAVAGGNLLNKTTREALKIIENKSKVHYSRSKLNVSRVNTNSRDNVSKTDDRIDKLADQISNLVEIINKQVITPAKAVEKTYVTFSPPNRARHQIPPPGFASVQKNPNRFNQGQGNYFNQANNFNQGNNFRGNNFQNNQGYRTQINNASNFQNQGFQNQPFSVPNNQIPLSVPNEFSSYMKSNETMIKSMQNQINILRGDFNKQEENLRRNLNNDMRSILGSFFQNQPSTSGTLPSNTIPNPEGEMKAVTTRSGLAYEGPSIPKPDVPRTQSKPTILYPSRLNDQKLQEKATNQMEKLFKIFHDLHSDIIFADALLLMPKFASTIKSLLANKDKVFELAKVMLNENCSAMLLKKLSEKLGDPGKFLILCDFLRIEVCHALAELGASINLMTLSIWKKLSLPELTPTRMTLELADRSITRPKGVAEDVFVKVGKFHFPTDFVVVDFKADPRVPLILGRSFLRTDRALIDVYGEEITLRVNDESITFNLNQTMRYSSTYDDTSVNRVDVIDVACEDFVQDVPIVKSSSPTLTLFGESDFFLEEIEDFLNDDWIPTGIKNSVYDPEGDILFLKKLLNEDPFQLPPMDLKLAEESKEKSSVEEPPELELKELPSHLEEALINDLKSHKQAIAWKITNIKGIDPRFCTHKILMEDDYKPAVQSQRRAIAWKITNIKGIDPRFCTHKILMEDDYKPAVQSQRRVNPKIHDVIKKEVIKLLDTDYKLPDKVHVFLRVLREKNMYNVDLKNVVPLRDLTCFFAKAILDESNLWHRRLGHINFKTMNKLVKANKDETSALLKTFITGIENQNRKVKIIRSDNGTEFKNQDLNQFCGMKGIKREFSVARTPQQNKVAERKNRTLIEATRTMLVDSSLPIPFWAEAVNTACYVQNRVLVTKPHNKRPYELLLG
nr:reverse transcriptase domain-containing protein [Tanacetum cinerariifolium]